MIYLYTDIVLTSINLIYSCFVHVQQHAHLELRARDIPITTGACLFITLKLSYLPDMVITFVLYIP